MAYTAGTITAGDTIAASWGNKVEDHLERLGNYMGVVASVANLPNVATVSDGDWYWCKAERIAKMKVGSEYITLSHEPDLLLSDSELNVKCQDSTWATTLFNSQLALNSFLGGPLAPYLAGTLLKHSATRTLFEANTNACNAVMDSVIYPRMLRHPLSLAGLLASTTLSASVWSTSNDGANPKAFFEAGTPPPPFTYYDYSYGIVQSEVLYGDSVGYYLSIYQLEKRRSGAFTWSIDIDFTGISSLKIYTQKGTTVNTEVTLLVKLDETVMFSSISNHSWTERIFDVSAYSGVKSLELSMYNTTSSTNTGYSGHADFAQIRLVRSS